jgi:hypothetical protein
MIRPGPGEAAGGMVTRTGAVGSAVRTIFRPGPTTEDGPHSGPYGGRQTPQEMALMGACARSPAPAGECRSGRSAAPPG